ncbi:MAG: hypothetical protein LAT82_00385 [Nanoarchaeota archaeon]|nr:hypothetical protein [Nanoarchaeota archaeon]
MNKKAQVSIFVIIGIIVVVSVIILTQLNSNYDFNEQNSMNNQINSIQDFISTCIQKTTHRGIIENLERGGYYTITSYESIEDNFLTNVPLYYNGVELLIPTIKIFEEELSKFITDEIDICFDSFSSFEEVGYLITPNQDFSTNVLILDNSILINSQFPISGITPQKENFDIQEFRVEIDVNIKEIINHMGEFIKIHSDDFTQFPISSLIMLSEFEDFLFELDQLDDIIIVTFIYNDNSSNIIGSSISNPIYYNFALEYNFKDDLFESFDLLSEEELFPDQWDWED